MKGLLKLLTYSFGLFLFFAYIGPFIIAQFPTWGRFNDALDEHNIPGGALYYTEIPFIEDAVNHVDSAVNEGMRKRSEKNK